MCHLAQGNLTQIPTPGQVHLKPTPSKHAKFQTHVSNPPPPPTTIAEIINTTITCNNNMDFGLIVLHVKDLSKR
jgi:hypothetical protein